MCAMLVAGTLARAQTPAQSGSAAANLTTMSDSALEARTTAIASQLRCPVCQGLSIQDSPSDLARSMRSLVREQLAAGRSPYQVKTYFVSKYGEWILLAPPTHGFNLVAYVLPVLVVVVGGAVIALAVRRWTGATDDAPANIDSRGD
jgi:cytochrome c-type biogenesis protein CcmH